MKHSVLSPSASKRWLRCPASIGLAKRLGAVSRVNPATIEGTAVHQVIENCFMYEEQPSDYIGETITVDDTEHTVVFTEAMADNAAIMLDYCLKKEGDNGVLYPEIYLYTDFGVEGLDGGTCDCLILDSDSKWVTVVDYKNGNIPVDVEYNSQLMIYALGAIDKFNLSDKCLVELTIIQPNVSREPKSMSMMASDVLMWRDNVLIPRAKLAISDDAPFNPDDEICQFCPCAGDCSHLKQFLVETAKIDFADSLPEISALTAEQKSKIVLYADAIKHFLDNVTESVTNDMLEGSEEYNSCLKLVRKATKRRYIPDTAKIEDVLTDYIEQDEIFETKMRGISAIEKALKTSGLTKQEIGEVMNIVTEKPLGDITVATISDKRAKIEMKQE